MEFIETLYVKNGNILNLNYHLDRIKKTAKHFKWKTDISEKLKIKSEKLKIKSEKLRIRIIYDQWDIKKIEYFPIKQREFKRFKTININNFDYSFKYKNRQFFTFNFTLYAQFDEFILLKNNLVTDTTISNLAFFTGNEWLTPKYPLLKGTKREELIKKGFLKEANIHKSDLRYFKKIAMINAILGFKEIEDYDIIS